MALNTINYRGYDPLIPLAFRNRLINGDMRVAQRSSVTVPSNSVTYTGADRWYLWSAGSTSVTDTSWAGPGFQKALKIAGASGNTTMNVGQRIEAANSYDLVGQPMVFSAWLYCTYSITPQFGVATPNAVDNFSAATWQYQNLSLGTLPSGTWTKVRQYFTGPATATNGMSIEVATNSGIGAGNTFAITGAQLEIATNQYPSPYEWRPYPLELMMCQRYYEIVNFPSRSNSSPTWTNSIPESIHASFHVPKRISPQMTEITAGTQSHTRSYGANVDGVYVWPPQNGSGGWYSYGLVAGADAELR